MSDKEKPFDVFWLRLCRSNPKLGIEDAVMSLTVKSLRKVAAKAFHAGQEDAQQRAEAGKAFEKLGIPKSAFESIFGERR